MHYKSRIFILIGMLFLLIGCKQDASEQISENENLLKTKGFKVNSESTDLKTSVNGTIFFSGKNEPEYARVVATMEIDPKDWGGIAFHVPNNWGIKSITSSYPEETEEEKPKHNVATWTTKDKNAEWQKRVVVGKMLSNFEEGGGKGSIVIELEPQNPENYDEFNMLVAVGSKEEHGTRFVRPDSKRVEVNLSEYNH